MKLKGLQFLHNSLLQCHGNLRSSYCLIDERWQVKISYYGLRSLKKFKEIKTNGTAILNYKHLHICIKI